MLAAAAVLICLLPFHTKVSPGGGGSVQWAIEAWLAGDKAYSLRQLSAAGQPYLVFLPAMASPALQLALHALSPNPRWRAASSLAHGLLLLASLLSFFFLFLLSAMVAVSGVGVALVLLWHLLALVLAGVLGARGLRDWTAQTRSAEAAARG